MPTKMHPFFSVIIPVYNKSAHIGRCLESVLAQSFTKFELIAVDDCSTDNSLAEIQKFRDPRLRLLTRDRNGPGPGPARNLGVYAANSEWCAFLDADDAWSSDYLETMEKTISGIPGDVGFLFSGFHIVRAEDRIFTDRFTERYGDKGQQILDFPTYVKAWLSIHNSPNRTSATVIKRDLLLATGGFPEDGRCERGEDKDTWLRVAARTKTAYAPFMGMKYYSDSMNMVTKNATLHRRPCIYETIRQLASEIEIKPYSKLLRKLYNDEVMGYAKETLRSEDISRTLFRGFFISQNPLHFVALLTMWLFPARIIRLFGKKLKLSLRM